MANADRMFRVIVLGGIALAATAAASTVGCGGAVSSSSDGGPTSDAFPFEGAMDAFPQETAQQVDAFPQETAPPPLVDSGADAGFDAFPQEGPAFIDSGVDAFPQEGPPPLFDSGVVDATGSDAPGLADGFPQETAQRIDP
jgi:hypothetical protein